MAEVFRSKIIYARERSEDKFTLVFEMYNSKRDTLTYVGGIAVIADLKFTPMNNGFIEMQTDLKLNWLEYREIPNLKSFIENDVIKYAINPNFKQIKD